MAIQTYSVEVPVDEINAFRLAVSECTGLSLASRDDARCDEGLVRRYLLALLSDDVGSLVESIISQFPRVRFRDATVAEFRLQYAVGVELATAGNNSVDDLTCIGEL